jgi:hypothetical protein
LTEQIIANGKRELARARKTKKKKTSDRLKNKGRIPELQAVEVNHASGNKSGDFKEICRRFWT